MSEVFEELPIGNMTARNRIVRSATAEELCTLEGVPSKRLADFYGELARGGVGTIITGYAYVCPDGKPSARALNMGEGADEDACRSLVEAAHEDGARIVAQLVYGGSKSPAAVNSSLPVIGPSAIEHPKTGVVPREAAADDLKRVANAFGAAAERAKRLGFDGVEVHAAHGYLLSQFLDGRFNQRVDGYGGSLEGRARFVLECVRTVRHAVGEGYPVLVKLNSCDVHGDTTGDAGGFSEEESLQVAQWLVEAGASCIDVSGDWHAVEADDVSGEPFFGSFGTRLAMRLGAETPVIVTGGWRDLDTVERYLETTGIAGIGLGRPLICQTVLPALWETDSQRVAQCNSCNWCVGKNGLPCILRKGRG